MYNSKDEAIDKINFLLRNKKIAEKIAVKGMKKTLKSHTIQKRWRSFHEFFLFFGNVKNLLVTSLSKLCCL